MGCTFLNLYLTAWKCIKHYSTCTSLQLIVFKCMKMYQYYSSCTWLYLIVSICHCLNILVPECMKLCPFLKLHLSASVCLCMPSDSFYVPLFDHTCTWMHETVCPLAPQHICLFLYAIDWTYLYLNAWKCIPIILVAPGWIWFLYAIDWTYLYLYAWKCIPVILVAPGCIWLLLYAIDCI